MSTIDNGSMVAQLRANRERIIEDRHITIRLPGWDSLAVRYKRLPWDRAKALIDREPGDTTQELSAALDVLAFACDEVIFLDGEQEQGLDMRYEQALARLIGDEQSDTAPEVIMSVFADDQTALMGHAGEYITWALRLHNDALQETGKG